MKQIVRIVPCLLGCLLLAGCSVYGDAARTLFVEPWNFATQKDAHRTQTRGEDFAARAWSECVAENPKVACCLEFERGFKEGFADFLYAGGTGEAPPVPPRRLWNLDYRTPGGRRAVDDWFAGFRQGAAAARDGGYRETMTIRSSLLPDKHVGNLASPSEGVEQADPPEEVMTPDPTEIVPQSQSPEPTSREP